MRIKMNTLSFVLACALLAGPFVREAAADTMPIQLSLFTPVQIFSDTTSIAGFRFNLLYGRNADMTGFDLGLVNHTTGSVQGGAVIAGFGAVISEVGAVMMVGGNIRGQTRVLTTATVLETRKGNFEVAIALSLILLALTFLITWMLTVFQQRSAAR